MTLKLIATVFIGSLAMSGAAQAAGDAAAGAAKAALCAACHGDKGQGVPPNPALASQISFGSSLDHFCSLEQQA